MQNIMRKNEVQRVTKDLTEHYITMIEEIRKNMPELVSREMIQDIWAGVISCYKSTYIGKRHDDLGFLLWLKDCHNAGSKMAEVTAMDTKELVAVVKTGIAELMNEKSKHYIQEKQYTDFILTNIME